MTSFIVSNHFQLEGDAEDVAEFAASLGKATRESFELELKYRGVSEAEHPVKYLGTFITRGIE